MIAKKPEERPTPQRARRHDAYLMVTTESTKPPMKRRNAFTWLETTEKGNGPGLPVGLLVKPAVARTKPERSSWCLAQNAIAADERCTPEKKTQKADWRQDARGARRCCAAIRRSAPAAIPLSAALPLDQYDATGRDAVAAAPGERAWARFSDVRDYGLMLLLSSVCTGVCVLSGFFKGE